MKVLVTGADGFVGSWLVPRFATLGHHVVAAVFSRAPAAQREAAITQLSAAVEIVDLDIGDAASVNRVAAMPVDAVIHLAAISSGADARRDPAAAWEVNAAGTARLAEAFAASKSAPLFLLASTGEVYGRTPVQTKPDEQYPTAPVSPYAASKLGAEIALQEIGRRANLRFIIARPFAHTGARQDPRFVLPAFAKRIIDSKALKAVAIPVGNLENVRDFLHVSDVVEAYRLLLERGKSGEIYNIASGDEVSLRDAFFMLADAAETRVIPEVDGAFMRKSDIPYLVGDAAKLRAQTGWKPVVPFKEAIQEVVNACTQ